MHRWDRWLSCYFVHVSVFSVFTLQQHGSVNSHCLQTSRSSCTPADPRAYQRVSWSPIATSSLVSREWLSGYPTCGGQHKLFVASCVIPLEVCYCKCKGHLNAVFWRYKHIFVQLKNPCYSYTLNIKLSLAINWAPLSSLSSKPLVLSSPQACQRTH